MTAIIRLVAAAAISIAASLPAVAEETKDDSASQPIPTLRCEFKSVNACAPDGTCKAGKDLAGMPLPLKVTVDFENTVVSAIDETGYARTDNIDAVADSAGQLIVPRPRSRLWLAASVSFASADFGHRWLRHLRRS
jgi:hypothetical protein